MRVITNFLFLLSVSVFFFQADCDQEFKDNPNAGFYTYNLPPPPFWFEFGFAFSYEFPYGSAGGYGDCKFWMFSQNLIWPKIPSNFVGLGYLAGFRNDDAKIQYDYIFGNRPYLKMKETYLIVRLYLWFENRVRQYKDCSVLWPTSQYSQGVWRGMVLSQYIRYVTILGVPLPDENMWPYLRPCAPGTWLTCQKRKACTYEPPFTEGVWNYSDDGGIFRLPPDLPYAVPLGSCYPCESGYDLIHYNVPNNVECSMLYAQQNKDIVNKYAMCFGGPTGTDVSECFRTLPAATKQQIEDLEQASTCISRPSKLLHYERIFCPGGLFPPVLCAVGFETNDDYTDCWCARGKYAQNGECVDCEPGHYCLKSQKHICPDETFQDMPGQWFCKNCSTDDGTSLFQCPRNTNTQPARCLSKNGLDFVSQRKCIECSRCYNPVFGKYNSNSGYIECYT